MNLKIEWVFEDSLVMRVLASPLVAEWRKRQEKDGTQ
jgi:hypothetical protein